MKSSKHNVRTLVSIEHRKANTPKLALVCCSLRFFQTDLLWQYVNCCKWPAVQQYKTQYTINLQPTVNCGLDSYKFILQCHKHGVIQEVNLEISNITPRTGIVNYFLIIFNMLSLYFFVSLKQDFSWMPVLHARAWWLIFMYASNKIHKTDD
jgi:hypothetical protein